MAPGSVAPMTSVAGSAGIGALLRDWRQRRRLSQLDLALVAGVSARHLSCVETGRARPSAEMVLRLAGHLDVPLRDRNSLLLAAGFAPVYEQRPLDAPEMAAVREAIDLVLAGHDPLPAVVADQSWNLVAANRGMALFTDGVAPELLKPPANILRMTLHPEGMASRIINLGVLREHLLEQLARRVAVTSDPADAALLEELRGYPGRTPDDDPVPPAGQPTGAGIVVPVRVRSAFGELSFFSMIATFGTAVDITVAELSIESFFPADAATAEALRTHAATVAAHA